MSEEHAGPRERGPALDLDLNSPGGRAMQAAVKGSPRLGRYLRSLRQGYGYSLRKVEERARREGGEIDNSQLSRYEKGVCYPSFDKLRVLASIFNVSVQTFSDIVDLEAFEDFQPETTDVPELLESGHQEFRVGSYGRAYACYERAREILDEEGERLPDHRELRARARLSAAIALEKLGKLSLSEHELRLVLREERHIDPSTLTRTLLQLSNVHEALGDQYLSEMEARRALDLAGAGGDRLSEAMAHHAVGRILQDRELHDEALPHHHAALSLYRELDNRFEELKVRLNLGGLYCARGRFREGVRILTEAQADAKKEGFRWVAASAGTWLAEVHYRRGDHERARRHTRESNAMASSGEVKYVDILFLNAFYLWKISRSEGNTAQAKIAFGRMKYLRSSLEQSLPEVREFDQYIQEKGGAR